MTDDVRGWLAADSGLSSAELTERIRRLQPADAAASSGSAVHSALRRRAGFGPLTPLLDSDEISDICINGPGEVWVDAEGQWHRSGIRLNAADLQLVVERLLAHSGRRIDRLHPLVDGSLADGSRIHVAGPPAALGGPLVTIRRFRSGGSSLDSFGTPEQIESLRAAIAERSNILVSGPTGAGKTTLLAALLKEVESHERIVILEDTAELPSWSPTSVRLEANPSPAEGAAATSLRDLVRNALRMRPDRLVIGEVRGPEALDLLLALNTGHRGSLTTCHGSGPVEVLDRLAVLAQLAGEADRSAIRTMIDTGIDVVVQVEREGRHRRIRDIVRLAKIGARR